MWQIWTNKQLIGSGLKKQGDDQRSVIGWQTPMERFVKCLNKYIAMMMNYNRNGENYTNVNDNHFLSSYQTHDLAEIRTCYKNVKPIL